MLVRLVGFFEGAPKLIIWPLGRPVMTKKIDVLLI